MCITMCKIDWQVSISIKLAASRIWNKIFQKTINVYLQVVIIYKVGILHWYFRKFSRISLMVLSLQLFKAFIEWKMRVPSVGLLEIWNSCKSVFSNTCSWELQEWNKTKTQRKQIRWKSELGKSAGTKKISPGSDGGWTTGPGCMAV